MKSYIVFQIFKLCKWNWHREINKYIKKHRINLDYTNENIFIFSKADHSAIIDYEIDYVDGDPELCKIARDFYQLIQYDTMIDRFTKLPIIKNIYVELNGDDIIIHDKEAYQYRFEITAKKYSEVKHD